jgi:hypothetical protein
MDGNAAVPRASRLVFFWRADPRVGSRFSHRHSSSRRDQGSYVDLLQQERNGWPAQACVSLETPMPVTALAAFYGPRLSLSIASAMAGRLQHWNGPPGMYDATKIQERVILGR